jgi:hypothetical protein
MPLIAKSNTFAIPLTPFARLVHYSLKETPRQTLEQLQDSTGIKNLNTVREAVRLLMITSLATMTFDMPRTYRTLNFPAPATVEIVIA